MAPPDRKNEVRALSPLGLAIGLGSAAGVWLLFDLLGRLLR